MFGFFKKRENGLKKIVFLLEQVFLEANEAFLLKKPNILKVSMVVSISSLQKRLLYMKNKFLK